MALWSWLATVATIYTATRDWPAIPFSMALALCSFYGLTGLRRNWRMGVAWVGGDAVGVTLGLWFP